MLSIWLGWTELGTILFRLICPLFRNFQTHNTTQHTHSRGVFSTNKSEHKAITREILFRFIFFSTSLQTNDTFSFWTSTLVHVLENFVFVFSISIRKWNNNIIVTMCCSVCGRKREKNCNRNDYLYQFFVFFILPLNNANQIDFFSLCLFLIVVLARSHFILHTSIWRVHWWE